MFKGREKFKIFKGFQLIFRAAVSSDSMMRINLVMDWSAKNIVFSQILSYDWSMMANRLTRSAIQSAGIYSSKYKSRMKKKIMKLNQPSLQKAIGELTRG